MSVIFSFGRRYGEVDCCKASESLGRPNMPVTAAPAVFKNDRRSLICMTPSAKTEPAVLRHDQFLSCGPSTVGATPIADVSFIQLLFSRPSNGMVRHEFASARHN